MAGRRKKEAPSWSDFFDVTEQEVLDESKETKKEEVHEKVESLDTLDKPGTSSGTKEIVKFEDLPLVDSETGQMCKIYEILMKKLGIEIPELKNENLSDMEKKARLEKRENIIIFEGYKRDFGKTYRKTLEKACILCYYLMSEMRPIKGVKVLPCSTPETTMTRVKFWCLEDKLAVLVNKHLLNKTRINIDHDLTRMEISLQAEILKLWNQKISQKNVPLTIPEKIYVDNKWVAVKPVSQQSAGSN